MVNNHSDIHKYKSTDIGTVPKDWGLVKLGDLFEFKNGLNKEKKYFGVGTPIVNYVDVYKNRGLSLNDLKGRVTVSLSELSTYDVRKDDVFFTRTSETVEEIGISAVVIEEIVNTVFSGFILRARPTSNLLDTHYKKYCFSTEEVRKEIISRSTYTTRALINGKQLSQVPILLPSMPEQKAIAEALNDIEKLITTTEQLIEKKLNIKKGTLQILLSGEKRLSGFTTKWTERKLGECLKSKPEYGLNAAAVAYSDNLPVYIRITDITPDGRFNKKNRVSVRNKDSNQFILENEDIVFARTGASTGKTYLYDPRDGELVFAGFLIRVKVNTDVLNARFLKYFTETSAYWNWVKATSMRSGQPGINGNEYAQMPIVVPSIKEQEAISQILFDMDKEIEALRFKLEKYLNIKEGMMQQLLTGKVRII